MYISIVITLKPKCNPYWLTYTIILVFICLNILSFSQHKPLFHQLLIEEHSNTFILNETHLKSKYQCNIPGFKIIRQDSTLLALRTKGCLSIGFFPKGAHRQYSALIDHLLEYILTTLYHKQSYVPVVTIYVRQDYPVPLKPSFIS